MHRVFSLKDAIVVFSLSIIFSNVSFWVLFTTKKARQILRPEIVRSLETAEKTTIASLPSTIILPLIAYFPFWALTFGLIRLFINLEKRRRSLIL